MKLYTEDQVVNALQKVFLESITFEDVNEVVRNLTPIELPSDEEIGKEFKHSSENWEVRQALEVGAKWMRDKIHGGNNEQ